MNSTDMIEGRAEIKPQPADTLLRDAIRAARAARTERADSQAESRMEEIGKLEVLEDRLKALISEVPPDHTQFDLKIARSNPPRFWIDVVAYVAMNRERTAYDFVVETRAGRKRVVQSHDTGVIADAVRDYVADRIVERERAIAGDIEDLRPQPVPQQPEKQASVVPVRQGFRGATVLLAFLLGMMCGAAALLAYGYVSVSGISPLN